MRVQWFDAVEELVATALRELPISEQFPPDLFVELMSANQHPRKRIGVVSTGCAVVAVVGVVREKRHWRPFATVHRPEIDVLSIYAALRVDIEASSALPPPPDLVIWAYPAPTRRLDLQSDFRAHWSSSSSLSEALRKARNRTAGFTFVVNAGDDFEWVLQSWAEKWRDDAAGLTENLPDRLATARLFKKLGALHSFVLYDGDQRAAGLTAVARGGELSLQTIFCAEGYRWHSAGNRVFQLTAEWAESRFEVLNFANNLPYVERWVPAGGEEWTFMVGSKLRHRLKTAMRTVAERLLGPARRAARPLST